MQNKKKRLGRQIAVRTAIPLAIILATLVTFMMISIQGVLTTLKLREINSQSSVAMDMVESYFDPYFSSNIFLSNSDLIVDLLKEGVKKGESFRYEKDPRYDELVDLLYNQQIALGSDAQAVWVCGFGNKEMAASTGFTTEPGLVPESRPWYALLAASGENSVVSAAYEDLETGKIVVSVLKGVYDNGILIGTVATDVAMDGMMENMDAIHIGETGSIILCDIDGFITYAKERDHIMHNVADHNYPREMQEALSKEEDTPAANKYILDGDEYYSAICYSSELGWRLIGTMPNKEFMQEAWDLGLPLFWIAIFSTLIVWVVCTTSGKIFAKPMIMLADATGEMAQGELDVEINVSADNEVGVLAEHIGELVQRLKTYIAYIEEASTVLRQMGDGDLRIELKQDYVGEFASLKSALLSVRESLVQAISQIGVAAQQVDSGTSQISSATQALAQGTTEQASAVEELAATITNLSQQSADGAQVAENLKNNFAEVNKNLNLSDEHMKQLLAAMSDISDKSDEISKIVKTISDIAFQTNILALNAAVEAARAGQAGKGFSVVADEVRSLASKCDEATNLVDGLVQGSSSAVTHGATLAKDTARALNYAASTMGTASQAMEDLAERYTQEASTLNQVANGIDQISVVVQTNSATAEQTAAGSEELAAQAKTLYSLTERFHV